MKRALYRLDAASKAPRDRKRWPHDLCREAFNEVKDLRAAIHGIGPWLSASLEDDCCDNYRAACNAVFEMDTP